MKIRNIWQHLFTQPLRSLTRAVARFSSLSLKSRSQCCHILQLLWIIPIITVFSGCQLQKPSTDLLYITMNKIDYSLEIADSPEEWEHGLQHRTELQKNTGMIFLFPDVRTPTFWMKNTLIPLDILWVVNDHVVDIDENVQPEPGVPDQQLKRYSPSVPVDTVIELPAGTVKEGKISVGEILKDTLLAQPL